MTEPRPAGAAADAPEKLIFKSDDKIQKRKARFMLKMVDKLNNTILPDVPERHDPRIVMRCVTCHRGSPLPQALDAVLTDIIDRHGVDSAIARYKELRENMESGRYDFSEWSVNELARTLAGDREDRRRERDARDERGLQPGLRGHRLRVGRAVPDQG